MGDAGVGWGELDYYSVLTAWPEYLRFRDAFVAVLDPMLYTAAWLDAQIWTGQFRLFTTENSAILTSVKQYPTGVKELHGEAATGNLGQIVHKLIPQAEAFARAQGCAIAVIQSRQGWAKAMQKHGYELQQTSIRKIL